MISIMNDYVSRIQLVSDDVTKGVMRAALQGNEAVEQLNIMQKSNRFIVDIKLKEYSLEHAVSVMNDFMEKTRYHYSAYYVRFNEGSMVRYRYASCREDRTGFYCDVMISSASHAV